VHKFKFSGSGWGWLGWSLLYFLATAVIIPAPWAVVALNKWFIRNTTATNGDKLEFVGTVGQIWYWVVAISVLTIAELAMGPFGDLLYFLILLAAYFVFKWLIDNIRVNNMALEFVGNKWAWYGRNILVGLSGITIIGWAWVWVWYIKWLCENTKSEYGTFTFTGTGGALLWRVLVVGLASLVIIPIPWMVVWLYRWVADHITVTPRPDAQAMQGVAV